MGQAKPNGLTIYLPLVKVDEKKRLVTGVATSEMRDSDGEIIEYEASKKAFGEWIGNIREMHDPTKAVGKRVEIIPDDKEKKIYVTSYISEGAPDTWAKILDGTLAGYSVGGRVILKEVDKADPTTKRIKEFSMSELSVVDAPANPECMIGLVKSIGGVLRYVENDREDSLLDQVRKFKERRKRHMNDKDALKKEDKAAEEAAAAENEKKDEASKEDAKKADEGAAGSMEERIGKLEAGLASLTEAVKTLISTDEQAHADAEEEETEEGEDEKDGEDEEKEDAKKSEDAAKSEDAKADKAKGGKDDLAKAMTDLRKQNEQMATALNKLAEDLKKYAARPRQRKFVSEKSFASDQAEDISKSEKAADKKAEEIPADMQAIIEKCKAGTATPAEIRKRDEYLNQRLSRRFA